MSYLVLARKWRPKTFEDIIGQEYITVTLKNALTSGKLAHALIFSGPRGVGKTSSARIVAKALNCEKKDPKKLMCDKNPCSFCSEISEGRSIDVQEIDAASHTGVNDVREIIDNVKYLPSSGSNKVYIIDEAHMLSQAAFNALLKTLEEPPAHVLFILATTEPHKIPATILSRCQRYDFKKVPVSEIKNNLELITKKEKISIDEKTLYLVSREADGSVRDALSLMDQLIATFGNKINYDEAITVLGIVDSYFLKSLLKEIVNRNPKGSLETLTEALNKGVNPKKIADELTKLLRHIIMLKICGAEIVTQFSDEEKAELADLVSNETIETLELLFNLMLENSENVQKSSFPEMSLESMVVKLSLVNRTVPINEILTKLDSLKKNFDLNSHENDIDHQNDLNLAYKDDEKANQETTAFTPKDFKNYVSENNAMIGVHLESAESIEKNGNKITITFKNDSINHESLKTKKSINLLESLAKEMLNEEIKIELNSLGKAKEPVKRKEVIRNNKDKIKDDPLVKSALDIFDGRILKTKKKSKE